MKKNGFTLAEVLLSLGIVGVSAAVTLPTLLLNVEKRKAGPALMKAVNTLESASALALQMNDARKLSDTIKNKNTTQVLLLENILADYTQLTSVPNNVSYELGAEIAVSGSPYATKDGIVFYDSRSLPNVGVASKKFNGAAFHIYVDTNGMRGPNKFGRDVFELFVDEKGIVIPFGSYLWQVYQNGKGVYWETACKSMTKDNKDAPQNARACAGAIVDNGGRVLYNYEAIN